MAKYLFLGVSMLLMFSWEAAAQNRQTYYSIQNGNWNSRNTWSLSPDRRITPKNSPKIRDHVVLRHAIRHTPRRKYTHFGNVIIEEAGSYALNTGKGSRNAYFFRGDTFLIKGVFTCTSDFHHQKNGTREDGVMIIESMAETTVGDDLILNAKATLFVNDTCSQGAASDDIYFKGTGVSVCGKGSLVVPDKVRVWNDAGVELTRRDPDGAMLQLSQQICGGLRIYSEKADCDLGENFLIEGADPLPVTFLSFGAKVVQDQVELKWVTAQEENNAFFALERSVDGQNFSELERVAGAGNSYTPLAYQTRDASPLFGRQYYRLRQVDFDGAFSFSSIVEVYITPLEVEMMLYPNPSQGNPYLKLLGFKPYEAVNMEVIDMLGRVLTQQDWTLDGQGAWQGQLALALPRGTYWIRISHEGQQLTRKILVD